MTEKPLRPSEAYVDKTCVICGKPMQVRMKYVKLKWGKNDWRHKECYLKHKKFNRMESFDDVLW